MNLCRITETYKVICDICKPYRRTDNNIHVPDSLFFSLRRANKSHHRPLSLARNLCAAGMKTKDIYIPLMSVIPKIWSVCRSSGVLAARRPFLVVRWMGFSVFFLNRLTLNQTSLESGHERQLTHISHMVLPLTRFVYLFCSLI